MRKRSVMKNSVVILLAVLLASASLLPSVAGSVHSYFLDNEKRTTDSISSPSNNFRNRIGSNWLIKNILNKVENYRGQKSGLFNCVIHTRCGEIEKSTEIGFYAINGINVDNNDDTGRDGIDIEVQYLLIPWIELDPDLAIGLNFLINVQRVGDDIKDEDFSIAMEIGQNDIRVGYESPTSIENEIPNYASVSFMLLFYLHERTSGFRFTLDPMYSSGMENKKLVLFGEYNGETEQRRFSFEFDPAIKTQVEVKSSVIQGRWQYQFKRESSGDSKLTVRFTTIQNDIVKTVTIVVDQLPQELSFTLHLTPLIKGGGQLIYESSKMYDIELRIESDEIGACRYATLHNTPTKIVAEWTPILLGGSYHIAIESDGTTEFILQDSLTDPTVKLTVSDLSTVDLEAFWNLSNPGDFTVVKTTGISANLEINIDPWTVNIDSQLTAEHLALGWLLDVSGYLELDTNWQPISTIDLTIVSGEVGLRTVSEKLKTEDFRLSWTLWPPQEFDISRTGEIDISSIAEIWVYFLGTWTRIWPW